jgi:hypothetical protein
MNRALRIFATSVLLFGTGAGAQQLAPNAPPDQPVQANRQQVEAMERAIQPYIAQARATYPQAKARFLAGLPPKEVFFVTVLLRDSSGQVEQTFLAVRSIQGSRVYGRIATDIDLVKGYHRGDPYDVAESDIRDWTISKPDGTEEGNYVGKFLDHYHP